MHILVKDQYVCTFNPLARLEGASSYFVPMFLHTALCAVGERLFHNNKPLSVHGDELLTFAISLQLFPASRMVFNLCSSAGVQGVLVLLFLAGGADVEDSAMVGVGSPKPPGSP